MSSQFISYPILYQALVAIILLFLWNRPKVQRTVSIVASLGFVGLSIALFVKVWYSGTLTLQMGNWDAPFGISLVADTLASALVMLTSFVGLAVTLFSTATIISSRVKFGYFSILHFMMMGLCGAFLTGDIFNLYVWFEVIIISSFILLTIGGEIAQIEGAVKYFSLNMLASIIFLTAIALLYGLTGTLNMAQLALVIPTIENEGLVTIVALLFFVSFGIKSGVFPLYFWLPASYHTPPAAVSALFGGILTKVGVYVIIRVYTLIFPIAQFNLDVTVVVAVLTIISGALGAMVQKDLIKVFSYFIICHIGFMIAGISMGTELALVGTLFYMFHDIIVKSNLFFLGGVVQKITGTSALGKTGGLLKRHPKLSFLFAIPLFSLVGIPPLSGFWPKLALIEATYVTRNYGLLAAILFGSFVTLVVIAKVWNQVFAKDAPIAPRMKEFEYFGSLTGSQKSSLVIPIVFLSLLSLYIGLGAEHLQVLATRIAGELMHIEGYCNAVLSPGVTP
jgi:multicomponent Na+:H+ antiporter subunit D